MQNCVALSGSIATGLCNTTYHDTAVFLVNPHSRRRATNMCRPLLTQFSVPLRLSPHDRLRPRHWPCTGNGCQQRLDSQRTPDRAATADAATQENDRSRSAASHNTLAGSGRVGRRNLSDRQLWFLSCQQETNSMISKRWSGLRWRTSERHPQQPVGQRVCCGAVASVSLRRTGELIGTFRSGPDLYGPATACGPLNDCAHRHSSARQRP